ncbi:MAG: DUF4339 domain-containing protein, partial [Bacteroidota bacterium]
MKLYYLHDEHQQFGPFSLDEMRYLMIKNDTEVWRSGLPEWTTVGELPELRPLLECKPELPFAGKRIPPNRRNTKNKFQPGNRIQTLFWGAVGIACGVVIIIMIASAGTAKKA